MSMSEITSDSHLCTSCHQSFNPYRRLSLDVKTDTYFVFAKWQGFTESSLERLQDGHILSGPVNSVFSLIAQLNILNLCETIGHSLRLVCFKLAKLLILESSLGLKVGQGASLGIASAMSNVEKSTFIKCPHLANVVLKNSIVSSN